MTATVEQYPAGPRSPRTVEVTVIVASYDGAQPVVPLLRRLDAVLGSGVEVLVVDDGTDDLLDRVEWLGRRLRFPVTVLRRDTPLGGQVGAISDGLLRASGAAVVVYDGSRLHPVELIPDLLAGLRRAEVVVASRFARVGPVGGATAARRRLCSMGSWGRLRCSDPGTGLFAVRLEALNVGAAAPTGRTLLQSILALATGSVRIAEVPCPPMRRLSHAAPAQGVAVVRAALSRSRQDR